MNLDFSHGEKTVTTIKLLLKLNNNILNVPATMNSPPLNKQMALVPPRYISSQGK